MDLDRCLQYTSSWCISSLISLLNIFMRSWFDSYPCATNSSSTCCFSVRRVLVFPKVDLLHATKCALQALIFSKRQYIGQPKGGVCVHESQIIFSHSEWATLFSSNWWIFCHLQLCWTFCGDVVIRIGSWPE